MEPTTASDVVASHYQDGSPGSFVLRELIRDIPLPTDENGVRAHITCVDTWNGNLYIGTSSGEVHHYVSIPPDPSDGDAGEPSYIPATTIEPPYSTRQEPPDVGVKQILLLPNVAKACIVCNGELTFYTLPELSPAFEGKIKQVGCLWVGGLDRNHTGEQEENNAGSVVVICLRKRLRLIHIGEVATKIRDIELGGITAIEKRGDLACVANGKSYSLLDVVNQRHFDLFSISSSSGGEERALSTESEALAPNTRQPSRSFSSASPVRQPRAHERNFSLDEQPKDDDRLRPGSTSPWPTRRSSRQSLSPGSSHNQEEAQGQTETTATNATTLDAQTTITPAERVRALLPNIVSPTTNEFLFTTGTKFDEPGLGMFVNLDGDVTRGTIEFSSYPESLVLAGSGNEPSMASPGDASGEGYVLAIVRKQLRDSLQRGIEIQRWDTDAGEAYRTKEWLILDSNAEGTQELFDSKPRGLRVATSTTDINFAEIGSNLRLRRLAVTQHSENAVSVDVARNKEEDRLAARFTKMQANTLLYADDKISWVIQNPLITRLDQQLNQATLRNTNDELAIDVALVQHVINAVRGQDARDELEFVTLKYIRQKASLLLFGNLILQTVRNVLAYEHDKRRTEDALTAGDIDPRTILTLVTPLDKEISEGAQGIWLEQGLLNTVTILRSSFEAASLPRDPRGPYGENLLNVLKHYLLVWRKKKGFGSVADEAHVFQTVDAGLLHVLLLLDQSSPRGPGVPGTVRAELNNVVDRGVVCFDRAIELFEQFDRLYMLSRLYQSRKMASQVLITWKRILEGEKDAGGELVDGEQVLRRYLVKIRDPILVQDYGSWLARRNPKLGIQVFADDSSRVKFEPTEAVAILKEKAPGAVKEFLEHLVFGMNHAEYANDLIAFYLDTVLHELKESEDAKNVLVQSYETYRALRPPKPTYRHFITDNAIQAEWWYNRLRLLQLIGGSHGAASKYDVHTLRQRLAPYSNELVPEMIILNSREDRHPEALRLLTHGLGDYDTAIRYCLLGGSNIFHPSSGLAQGQSLPSMDEQSQLFEYLLDEFYRIDDLDERLERTAELLERFGSWFDIAKVLQQIPDSWSVEHVSGFLMKAFRRLVRDRHQSELVKALCSAQNLRQSVELIEKSEAIGPMIANETIDVG